MAPLIKPAGERRRRNRTPGARTLRSVGVSEGSSPVLPALRDWHEFTVVWWAALWESPMAPEYDACDLPSLVQLVVLVDEFNRADSTGDLVKLAAEIRLQRQCFGITPLDRRRLAWEIDRGEQAEGRREQRTTSRRPSPVKDPRVADGSRSAKGSRASA